MRDEHPLDREVEERDELGGELRGGASAVEPRGGAETNAACAVTEEGVARDHGQSAFEPPYGLARDRDVDRTYAVGE